MRVNIARVIKLLSTESMRNQKSIVHDSVLRSITMEGVDTVPLAVASLLMEYDNDSFRTDEYWIPVFEAFIVGNYNRADIIGATLLLELRSDHYKTVARAYPSLFVALLQAANWATEKSEVNNEAFEDGLASLLGNLCADYGKSARLPEEKNPVMSQWAVGKFLFAFKVFFDITRPGFWTRMSTFCECIVDAPLDSGTEAFMDNVSAALFSLMPTGMAVNASATSFLTMKRSRDANLLMQK